MKQGGFINRYTPLKSRVGFVKKKYNMMTKPKDVLLKKKFETADSESIKTDRKFSLWVRKRDKRCVLCGSSEALTCSHFRSRRNSSTRYDPENCDTFCLLCHNDWEVKKAKGQSYYQWKEKHLGKRKFKSLMDRSNLIVSREKAIMDAKILLSASPPQRELEEIII